MGIPEAEPDLPPLRDLLEPPFSLSRRLVLLSSSVWLEGWADAGALIGAGFGGGALSRAGGGIGVGAGSLAGAGEGFCAVTRAGSGSGSARIGAMCGRGVVH